MAVHKVALLLSTIYFVKAVAFFMVPEKYAEVWHFKSVEIDALHEYLFKLSGVMAFIISAAFCTVSTPGAVKSINVAHLIGTAVVGFEAYKVDPTNNVFFGMIGFLASLSICLLASAPKAAKSKKQ